MIRFTLRLVGLLLLAGAFAAAVIDGARSLADQKVELSSMGTVLAYAFPAKFALMHDYVVKKAPMLVGPGAGQRALRACDPRLGGARRRAILSRPPARRPAWRDRRRR